MLRNRRVLTMTLAGIVLATGGWLMARSTSDLQAIAEADIASEAVLFPVQVHRPSGPPRVDLGVVDAHGSPLTASCTTCHAGREANRDRRESATLTEFHGGLTFAHGDLACVSCHHPDDYDTLRLADGRSVSYPDVMNLCAQCHGSKVRDYGRGAHGGMTGYWDLTRGSRERNGCLDCHDAHAPAFPRMRPTFKPHDRFLSTSSEESHDG